MGASVKSRSLSSSASISSAPITLRNLSELLAIAPTDTERLDLAWMNLLCAEGLPGAENLNIISCLETLAQWTRSAKRYLKDCLPRFWRNPAEYDGHEGFFKFLCLVTFLKHPNGLRIRYQPSAIGNYDFSDSRDDLLHGLLTRRLGTCASLPMLFVAIGRRLGWPMHLAIAKQHVLCQWVNPDGSHRNLEGSGPAGGDSFSDEHYQNDTKPLTREEIASGRFLRPLTNAECLALFLEIRGHCLTDNKRFSEARQTYEHARRFAPEWSNYKDHLYSLLLHERRAAGYCSVSGYNPNANFQPINSPIPSRGLFPAVLSLNGPTYNR